MGCVQDGAGVEDGAAARVRTSHRSASLQRNLERKGIGLNDLSSDDLFVQRLQIATGAPEQLTQRQTGQVQFASINACNIYFYLMLVKSSNLFPIK